jgi:hydroxypyruvate reductase
VIVIGAGKASGAMARAVAEAWQRPLEGLIAVPHGQGTRCRDIEVIEAAHPVPDASSEIAAQRMMELVSGLSPQDQVIGLFSGGGSALLSAPLTGIDATAKQAINRQLLRCGASIDEINCVRRHLSAIKGGRLAAACHPAQSLTLLISDVPGDNPGDIASGPMVGDATTCADALEIVKRYGLDIPQHVRAMLEQGRAESVKPDDPRLREARLALIATPQQSLQVAADAACAAGITPYILSDRIEGEARDVAKALAAIAHQVARHRQPFAPPCVLLSGGETTVTVRGEGRGGRNVEFLLALAIALDGVDNVFSLSADTDGVDGRECVAGAFVDPTTIQRAGLKGIDPVAMLEDNDAHRFFEQLGDQLITGPTGTNVNDFRAILIAADSRPDGDWHLP